MLYYSACVSTGTCLGSGTIDKISLTLVSIKGSSPPKDLDNWGPDLYYGADTMYKIPSPQDLGDILLIRFTKKTSLLVQDSWYCNFVKVTSPEGKIYNFPVYQWVEGSTAEFREGKGIIAPEDPLPENRRKELEEKRESYKWKVFVAGIPRCLDVKSACDLDTNFQFSFTRMSLFYSRAAVTHHTNKIQMKLRQVKEAPFLKPLL